MAYFSDSQRDFIGLTGGVPISSGPCCTTQSIADRGRFKVGLRNAVTIGHPELRHFIQDHAGERSSCPLRQHRAAAHRAANDRFVSRHGRLHQAAFSVSRFMYPSSTTMGINGSDCRVTLTRCVGPAVTLSIPSGWDQDLWRRARSMGLNRCVDR